MNPARVTDAPATARYHWFRLGHAVIARALADLVSTDHKLAQAREDARRFLWSDEPVFADMRHCWFRLARLPEPRGYQEAVSLALRYRAAKRGHGRAA